MIPVHKRHLLALLLVALWPTFSAHGQEQEPVPEAVRARFADAEQTFRFRFRVYPQFPSDIPENAFFHTLRGGEVRRVELAFSATQPSQRYTYRGPSPLRFYFGKAGTRSTASLRLRPDAEPALLVFLSGDEGEYQLISLAEDPPGFREGTIRFLNLTPRKIFGRIGEQRMELASGSEKILRVRAGKQALDVRVQLAQFDAGDPELVYSSVWPVDRKRRSTVFLLPSQQPGRGSVSFRSFAEMPPEAESEERE